MTGVSTFICSTPEPSGSYNASVPRLPAAFIPSGLMISRALLPTLILLVVAVSACSDDDADVGIATPSGDSSPDATAEPSTPAWSSLAPVPTPRSEVAVGELDGLIYVIGGFLGSGGTTNKVEAYDPATDSWTDVAPLPEPRHHAAAIGYEGKLYVFGGYFVSFSTPTSTVYEYDPATDQWTDVAVMPRIRAGHAVAEVGGMIYVIGGASLGPVDAPTNIAEVDVWDPATGAWSPAAPLPTIRDHLGAAAVDGIIYAVGGRVEVDFGLNLAANEAYDPSTDEWTALAPLPTTRSGLAVAALNGAVYVMGGEGLEGTFDTNEAYDVASGVWLVMPSLPTARHGMGAAVVGDVIYVPAGGPVPALSVTGANEALGVLAP